MGCPDGRPAFWLPRWTPPHNHDHDDPERRNHEQHKERAHQLRRETRRRFLVLLKNGTLASLVMGASNPMFAVL